MAEKQQPPGIRQIIGRAKNGVYTGVSMRDDVSSSVSTGTSVSYDWGVHTRNAYSTQNAYDDSRFMPLSPLNEEMNRLSLSAAEAPHDDSKLTWFESFILTLGCDTFVKTRRDVIKRRIGLKAGADIVHANLPHLLRDENNERTKLIRAENDLEEIIEIVSVMRRDEGAGIKIPSRKYEQAMGNLSTAYKAKNRAKKKYMFAAKSRRMLESTLDILEDSKPSVVTTTAITDLNRVLTKLPARNIGEEDEQFDELLNNFADLLDDNRDGSDIADSFMTENDANMYGGDDEDGFYALVAEIDRNNQNLDDLEQNKIAIALPEVSRNNKISEDEEMYNDSDSDDNDADGGAIPMLA